MDSSTKTIDLSYIPDCMTCTHQKTCPRASQELGKFCLRWRSVKFPEGDTAKDDPNDAWARGEETDF